MVIGTAARSQLLQSRLTGLSFLSLEKTRDAVATSVETLDRLLPDGGLLAGSFVEILGAHEGSGAYTLALTLAREALTRREAWAVVDPEGTFYPPAAAAMGYDLKKLILLRPKPTAFGTASEDTWAFTQLLRSTDISVCFWMTNRMDNMVFRRLQLAAEHGDGLGFVLRPIVAERKPCWASLRLMASWRSNSGDRSSPRSLSARVLHAAGRLIDSTQEVEVTP